MKRFSFSLYLIFIIGYANCQEDQSNTWSYFNLISEQANKTFDDSIYETIIVDSFNIDVFKGQVAKLAIDTSANWKICFVYNCDWEQYFGIQSTDSIYQATKNIKQIYDNAKIYNGKELYLGFNLPDYFLNPKSEYINSSPLTFQRANDLYHANFLYKANDLYHANDLYRQWVPIMTGDYLILRYIYTYPYGTITGLYYSTAIYFKRMQ